MNCLVLGYQVCSVSLNTKGVIGNLALKHYNPLYLPSALKGLKGCIAIYYVAHFSFTFKINLYCYKARLPLNKMSTVIG